MKLDGIMGLINQNDLSNSKLATPIETEKEASEGDKVSNGSDVEPIQDLGLLEELPPLNQDSDQEDAPDVVAPETSEVERDLSMEKQVPNEEEQAESIEKEDEQAPEEVQEP